MRDTKTGICSECASPPEAYHARRCSLFKGYYCTRCGDAYFGEYCPSCPSPFRFIAYCNSCGRPHAEGECGRQR